MRSATRLGIGKDAEYLAFIASLPCLLCVRMPRWTQKSRTEVAHIGAVRGLSQKCDDRQTAPLCGECHRTGRWSHHNLGRKFWEFHGLDRETVIATLQDQFERTK